MAALLRQIHFAQERFVARIVAEVLQQWVQVHVDKRIVTLTVRALEPSERLISLPTGRIDLCDFVCTSR